MSVEASSSSSTPRTTAGAESGHVKGKGKAHSAGDGGSADAGGFSSLLMMLGADDTGELQPVGPDDAALASTLATKDAAPLDPALLLAQSIQLPPALSIPPGAKGHAPVPADLTVKDAVAKDAKPDDARNRLAKLNAADEAPKDEASDLLAKAASDDKEPAVADLTKDAVKEPSSNHRTAKNPMLEDGAQTDKARLALEEHANKAANTESALSKTSALPQITLASGSGESGLKQAERLKERLALKQVGGSEGGAWGHQALVQAGRIDAPSATTGTAALSPEMMVAEQVNYWIGRNVQNAELKLDGMGEGSLKVNISLSGNEARVEFRTDQAQARQVLEGAVSHLKDLLGNEGLVLSSVLVGGSNSGAADSREGTPQAQSRRAAVAVPDVLVQDAVARPATLSGRTVDLFV